MRVLIMLIARYMYILGLLYIHFVLCSNCVIYYVPQLKNKVNIYPVLTIMATHPSFNERSTNITVTNEDSVHLYSLNTIYKNLPSFISHVN